MRPEQLGVARVVHIRGIRTLTGAAWTGVEFCLDDAAVPGISAARDVHFCEPALKARSGPLIK